MSNITNTVYQYEQFIMQDSNNEVKEVNGG